MATLFKSLLLLLCLSLSAHAAERITLTITVTNTPSDGNTLVVNADTRTWKTTVATPSTQVTIGASIGAAATNLWNQIVANPYSGPLNPSFSSSNVVTLRGQTGGALSASISGTWATLSLSTQTVATASIVRVPFSSEPTASTATNIASLVVSGVSVYSTNTFSETAVALTNHVNLTQAQTFGNKLITNSTLSGSTASNVVLWPAVISRENGTTNNAIYFKDAAGDFIAAIAPNDDGNASLYIAESFTYDLTDPWAFDPAPEEILNAGIADFRYGQLAAANAWTGTNTFTRITNSAIVNSTLTGSTYSGTIGTLTGGSITAVTITSSIISGGFGDITSGNFINTTATNLVATNTVLKGTTSITGLRFPRSNHTSLANGANAGADFGEAVFIKIKAGPTAAFSIAGIANGSDGDIYYLYNATGQNMTISHDSGGDPTAANRIYTNTGADLVTVANGGVWVCYDSEDSRWRVLPDLD